jgi:hypothetical protein
MRKHLVDERSQPPRKYLLCDRSRCEPGDANEEQTASAEAEEEEEEGYAGEEDDEEEEVVVESLVVSPLPPLPERTELESLSLAIWEENQLPEREDGRPSEVCTRFSLSLASEGEEEEDDVVVHLSLLCAVAAATKSGSCIGLECFSQPYTDTAFTGWQQLREELCTTRVDSTHGRGPVNRIR